VKTFYLNTFGCKLNQADGAAIRAALKARGLREAAGPAGADLIVVNTCTVTGRADAGARGAIRRLKRAAPGCTLYVTGCYAEQAASELAAMPEVDEVFGLAQRQELYRFAGDRTGVESTYGATPFEPEIDFGGKTRAFLKVQEGCDRECSYCVVRIARGPSRSLAAEEVLTRLRRLAERGYREVVLTGTHLGLWGADSGSGGLKDLLARIDDSDEAPFIRLCSLEPFEVDDEMLELIAASRRIAHHLHLAVQSGSEAILKAMKRPPEPDSIRHIVERARELMPQCGLGADVIVGFPGESDEDFADTFSLLTEAPFTYAHVFSFSPRPGTEAAGLPHRVHTETIKNRSAKLRAAMAEKNLCFRKSLIGETLLSLVLATRDSQGRPSALSGNYIHIAIENGSPPANTRCRIQVTSAGKQETVGRVVQ